MSVRQPNSRMRLKMRQHDVDDFVGIGRDRVGDLLLDGPHVGDHVFMRPG